MDFDKIMIRDGSARDQLITTLEQKGSGRYKALIESIRSDWSISKSDFSRVTRRGAELFSKADATFGLLWRQFDGNLSRSEIAPFYKILTSPLEDRGPYFSYNSLDESLTKIGSDYLTRGDRDTIIQGSLASLPRLLEKAQNGSALEKSLAIHLIVEIHLGRVNTNRQVIDIVRYGFHGTHKSSIRSYRRLAT